VEGGSHLRYYFPILYIFTGDATKALRIGSIEVFTKIFLFWAHERIWLHLPIGISKKEVNGETVKYEKHYRSIIKGASYRFFGSLDTFWIALLVNHQSITATQTAFYIAATEVITKVGLFWLHERLWMKIYWGRKNPALSM